MAPRWHATTATTLAPVGVVRNPATEAPAYGQTCWYSPAFVVFVVMVEPALTPDTA